MSAPAQFPKETAHDGSFVRQGDAFRGWVETPEAGRYRLYVSLACPWAHRTLIARALMGLDDAVSVTVVDPIRDERGWWFHDGDAVVFLRDLYRSANPTYDARVTVPVLWDTRERRLVSNSDDDIMRMFETTFAPLAAHPVDLYPQTLRAEIDALNERIYHDVNDGVYRAGFAASQHAYERPVRTLFATLDELDARLGTRRYLFGAQPVETDWRLFVTLVRFDAVYVGHFKCNLRRIADYPNLAGYLRDLYQVPGIAPTVDFDHIKRHYYQTHPEINPTRIVPLGPILDLDAPHDRARLEG